ncbi:MAG: type II secretion system protein [Candidatus Aenigmarchaeota archaeon]|nr:type II secretion system protein [Candidatus Aenigmarchaeota archaeon]
MRNRKLKGIMHMIEVIIAITMILTFLLVLRSKLQPVEDTGREQAIAAQALKALDNQGVLRSYAIDENHLGLNTQVYSVIPSDLNHTIRFCYSGNRCVGDTLPDKNIYTASYVITGNATYFKPAQILLHIWR